MLFHITHSHEEQTCPINNQDVLRDSFGKVMSSLTDNGVEVIGWWVDPPAHQMFFVVEADSAEVVYDGLQPIIDRGTCITQPVLDAAAKVQALLE
tara:strand:+ start:766 stop:1050 length:285 start_codon:yes stop_codon:yes gene_type:complete